jgi:hemolysin activation/secretion protein
MKAQQRLDKKDHWLTTHQQKLSLIAAALCLLHPMTDLAAAPEEFKFNVKHFLVEGSTPLSPIFLEDYFKSLQNQPYTLKKLQEVSKTLEQVIRKQGYPLYRVIVPPQSLASGDIRLQIITVDTLNCKVSKP